MKNEPQDRRGDSEREINMQSDEISDYSTFWVCRIPRKIKTGKKHSPNKEHKMIIPKDEKSQVVLENTFCDSCPQFSEALNIAFKKKWIGAIQL